MASNDMDRVVPLGQLDDFQVAEGEPDVRGWEVLASDGRKIGEVDELLVDTAAMKVRYLDVDVDDAVAAGGHDRHVLIPIGYARLDRDRDCVLVDTLASADLRGVPSYNQGPLTRDFETSVRDSFSGGSGMMDTAGLDNTPGAGTRLGMTDAMGTAGLTGSDTGMRMSGGGVDADPDAVHARGSSAGMMASADDGMGGARTGAGGQGPVGGIEREEARMRDASRGEGLVGSDSLHGSADDFYAGDAFDDARFYGARRGGTIGGGASPNHPTRGEMGLSAGTGGADQVNPLSGSGLSHTEPTLHGAGQEGVGADPDETRRLARDARELRREDQANRDVPGTGGL